MHVGNLLSDTLLNGSVLVRYTLNVFRKLRSVLATRETRSVELNNIRLCRLIFIVLSFALLRFGPNGFLFGCIFLPEAELFDRVRHRFTILIVVEGLEVVGHALVEVLVENDLLLILFEEATSQEHIEGIVNSATQVLDSLAVGLFLLDHNLGHFVVTSLKER